VKNVHEMAQKIELLLGNEKLRLKMGSNALGKAVGFSWPEHISRLIKLVKI
jgi:glycosyltransferase involved in cell wall biosynthesis